MRVLDWFVGSGGKLGLPIGHRALFLDVEHKKQCHDEQKR